MKASPRSTRLSNTLKEIFPKILLEHTSPNQFGILTVEHIFVSEDLSIVEIMIQSFGGKKDWQKEIKKKEKIFSYEINKKLNLSHAITVRIKTSGSL